MFFLASKLFWLVVQPTTLLLVAFAMAATGLFTRFARSARRLLLATLLVAIACAFGPVMAIVTRPLENRFPRPPADMAAPDGIIVLGGGMAEGLSEARHALILNAFGSRMTEGVALARRFPNARLVFTGGSADLLGPGDVTEADVARRLFLALGLPPARLTFESRSRNTYENAVFTRDLVAPKPGERFLLVTSAFHMPRAMGVFRKAGFDVTAWPADYSTRPGPGGYLRLGADPAETMVMVDHAVKEWIGLAAYRLNGMTDAFLPAP